jgi:integrase
MRTRLSYVKEFKDRHGKIRRYFYRTGQGEHIPLRGKPGSREFREGYETALALASVSERKMGRDRSAAASLGAVIGDYYETGEFKRYAESTRGMRRRILEILRDKFGQDPVAGLTRGHIVSVILTQLPPFERNNWIKTLRGLMKFALARGDVEVDPTIGIARSTGGGSIYTWEEPDIAKFRARHGTGSTPRLALELLLNTAQRRSDVVHMGPQHIRDGMLYVRQKKTKMEKEDRVLKIPVLPELQHVIDATPAGALAFLVTRQGVPFTEKGFGMRFGQWCEQAGLPAACSAHGLRKAACVRLLHAGCTPSEVQAISGHRNLSDLKPYIEKVEQERLARSAMDKLTGNASGTSSTPIFKPLAKSSTQNK